MITPAQNIKRKSAAEKFARTHHIPIPKGFNAKLPFTGRQARRLYSAIEKHEWPNLPPNGECDAKMLHLLFPPKPVGYGVLALAKAKTQLGVKENPAGSNHGLPYPTGYEAILGLDHQPWCACFVTWALRQVGWTERGWNQAYVPSWVSTAHAATHGLLTMPARKVIAGDIVTFDWDNDGIADHIGFVTSPVDEHGDFHTLEGNTSEGNNSNGGQVQERLRNVSDVECFIRIIETRV